MVADMRYVRDQKLSQTSSLIESFPDGSSSLPFPSPVSNSYSTVSDVIESWEAIRRMDNYEETTGVVLFQK
jgi:hypothetical protein